MAILDRLSAPILHRSSPVITVLTTGADTSIYKVEQTLLDSGASRSCINQRVVEKLGLSMVEHTHPLELSAAGGHVVHNTHETTLTFKITGIEQTILCYVEDREHHFILMLVQDGNGVRRGAM
ncbi:hypothetical protein AC579_10423 [Pseudocercospora musae]|uniref:Peptidase A2 domain-containing protein n=1 Tax=Pseudocercospora musae TaxID=113226 RepID=A0A139IMR4_9PEZI|nr:hypothetical protein AC579_10423 [Pseudocercospora musae]